MAQFDVYENSNTKTKKAYPYILDIQHPLIEGIATRIVVPLGDANMLKNQSLKGLTPQVLFEDKVLLILMPQITSMPSNALKNPVGSLSHIRDEIISALDMAITGI
jgi:toxin CcdB